MKLNLEPSLLAGDALGVRLSVRAGIPVLIASSSGAASTVGAAAPGCSYDRAAPNDGTRIGERLLRDPAFRADALARQRVAAAV
jgi:hypothetical protein